MARCSERCRKGFISPPSGTQSRLTAESASASKGWYSGWRAAMSAAVTSAPASGRRSTYFFQASQKKRRTCSREGLNMGAFVEQGQGGMVEQAVPAGQRDDLTGAV